MSVQDKVVIISGASGGLGQTVSQVFHRAGARVVLVGSQPERVQPLAKALGGDSVLPVGANLSNPAEAESVVEAALNRFGRVDILLNLAGGFSGGSPVHDSDDAVFQKMMAINLHTTYNLSRAAAKPMVSQQWGRIINIGSRDSLKGRANFSAYAMSKAAVLRLTESMADELKPYHITVNAILPGTIDTAANRQAMPHADFSTWVTPTAIAETMLFLTRSDSAITGAAIPVYGQT
jgi:NAD(P)-dependent dehydrogenase (short-subunit alcohol dehydrogenase family)